VDNISTKGKIILSLVITGLILLTYVAIALYKVLAPHAMQIGIGVLLVGGLTLGYLTYHQWYIGHMQRTLQKETVRQLASATQRENDLLEHKKWVETQELLHKQQLAQDQLTLKQQELTIRQMELTLEHQRLSHAQQHVLVPAGHTVVFPHDEYRSITSAARPMIAQQAEGAQDNFVKPVAPDFRSMAHLITTEQIPLCWTDGPKFGTVDDLLSMAVTGKPGRGKTTALMYYIVALLKNGAEVFVWDPHGAMGELAVLNGRLLPGMPATARVIYLDRKDDIVDSVPVLQAKLHERDEIYRECQRRRAPYKMHPLLLLADELPVLADYDDQVEAQYKLINKKLVKEGEEPEEVPSLIYIIRRFVLEARKWRCFFIGSGQSIDAEILPTKVTDALNSRIIFFNSDRKARMSGLETDAIKNLLPLLRRAGSGVMIFDCARWDEPVIGALPMITIEDMLTFLGIQVVGASSVRPGTVEISEMSPDSSQSLWAQRTLPDMPNLPKRERYTGPLNDSSESVLDGDERTVPTTDPTVPVAGPSLGPTDKAFTSEQEREFLIRYKKNPQAIKNILRQMNNGEGLGNAYVKHASWLLEQNGMRG
jgi:hypothetical protein